MCKKQWYKPKKVKKLALNPQLLTVQILTNDVQVLILCLSYLITTVLKLVHSATAEAFIILLLQQRQERQEDDYCATPQPKWQCWKNRSVFESFDFFLIKKNDTYCKKFIQSYYLKLLCSVKKAWRYCHIFYLLRWTLLYSSLKKNL